MTSYTFTKATKEQIKARIALIGPSGSGKTYTALRLATALGDRIAVIDTENNSASLYADEFNFDTLALDSVSPQTYVQAIHAAERAGYDVLIIDSLSHAWAGKDGALAMADQAAKKYRGNTFAAWRDVTPHHNALVDALIHCQSHLIVAMRSKTEYIIETEKGKMVPKKVGMAPIQRQGMEYEFDIVGDLDLDHNLVISKTRCKALDGQVITLPGEELGQTILAWLADGAEPPPAPEPTAQSEEATETPQGATGGNGASPWYKRSQLISDALEEISYYSHGKHIISTLTKLEGAGDINWAMDDETALANLRAYATRRADEKAEAEALGSASHPEAPRDGGERKQDTSTRPPAANATETATELLSVEGISNDGEFWMAVLVNLKLNKTQALAAVGKTSIAEVEGTTYQVKYATIARAVRNQ